MIACLALISFYYAWRYSKTSADPDWSMFNLAGFTGSWWGRDFADCKSPGVHLWYYLLSRIAGVQKLKDTQKGVERVKFLHHFFIGIGCIVFYIVSDQPLAALILLVLAQSGWLLSFHGNVSDIPTVLIAIALVTPTPWLAFWIAAAAVFYEPKLLFTFAALIVIKGWWLFTLFLAVWGGLTILIFRKEQWFRWLWEATVTIPGRMTKERRDKKLYDFQPWFTAQGMIYIMPWLFLAAASSRESVWFWVPACIYLITLGLGYAIRQNHMIPLAAWIAVGMDNSMILPALALILADWTAAGYYLGDLWGRFYIGLQQRNAEAREAGEYLYPMTGTLWVNELHTAVYIYARKPVQFGLAEQIEIREVAHERRETMKRQWKKDPPNWVVTGVSAAVQFRGDGYRGVKQIGSMSIYNRIR